MAGAAFLEISSGTGDPLDWEFAVIEAVAERAPTESMGELLVDVRTKVMPIIDEAQRRLANLNTITGGIADGEGALGRLLANDRLVVEVETLLTQVNDTIGRFEPMLESLQTTVGSVAVLSSQLAAQAGRLPELSSDTADILGSLQLIVQDLSRTTPELPKLIESVNAASGDLPILLMQTRQTLAELTVLLQQLQSHWLLGGGSRPTPVPGDRISPLKVRP